ncbi:MAG TPA: pentapeptide repeat-containing protein [Terriglobales bacterium]|jgi:hypothetical protein
MTIQEVQADIAAFADDENSVLAEKDTVIYRREGRDFYCTLRESSPGSIEIVVNGAIMPYSTFLGEELGRLSILASSVTSKRRDVVPYIDTRAELVDSLDNAVCDKSALTLLDSKVSAPAFGETRLLFLTGEAGEGKTALLKHLAYTSAMQYLARKRPSLFLHVDTQGRSFVRLEEAVARDIGQLRVSGLFYPGIVCLVRHGLLTIAVDGFDELLAEVGANEAYSGLGAFLRQLAGRGTVVAAARNAYFQAENYTSQSRLLSALPNVQVTVEQIRLLSWGSQETVEFFKKYKTDEGLAISKPEQVYRELVDIVGDGHVILTRPFLVNAMARMLSSGPAEAKSIIQDIGNSGLQVVPRVITEFLRREVDEKWRDPSGQPYLTLEQHLYMLAAVADELWSRRAKSIPIESLQILASAVSEELNIPVTRRVQISERVKAHVMLPSLGPNSVERGFEHDEFFEFFLAVRLCDLIALQKPSLLRRFLEQSPLPQMAARWTAASRPWTEAEVRAAVKGLSQISDSEVRSTYLKQNAGRLAARLASAAAPLDGLHFRSMYFEGDDWAGAALRGAVFSKCEFEAIDLSGCAWEGCRFESCTLQAVSFDDETSLRECVVDPGSHVIGVIQTKAGQEVRRSYVPSTCEAMLKEIGLKFDYIEGEQLELADSAVREEVRSALNGFLRIFARNSGATDGVIGVKLGARLSLFRKSVLPLLMKHGVVRESSYHGSGSQSRFELCYPVEVILAGEDKYGTAPKEVRALWDCLREL